MFKITKATMQVIHECSMNLAIRLGFSTAIKSKIQAEDLKKAIKITIWLYK